MKKCKNFLVTLIKLASSDPQAASMATNVRGLVGALLVRFPCSSFTVAASSSEVCRRVTPNRQKVGASAGWGVYKYYFIINTALQISQVREIRSWTVSGQWIWVKKPWLMMTRSRVFGFFFVLS